MTKNIIVIAEPFDFSTTKETLLLQSYVLKQAKGEQLKALTSYFQHVSELQVLSSHSVYEAKPEKQSETQTKFIPMPESDWRYTIIEHDLQQAESSFLDALLISDLNITSLGEILFSIGGPSSIAFLNFDVIPTVIALSEQSYKSICQPNFDSKILEEMADAYTLFSNMQGAGESIPAPLRSYRELFVFKKRSYLRTLGYFSIIESLVMHPPNGDYDSITHQFKTKFPLLNNLFSRPLKLDNYFQLGAAVDKILSRLYEFRSRIAHGSFAGFDGDLQILISHENIVNFLDAFVKRLILLSLRQPKLIADLKPI